MRTGTGRTTTPYGTWTPRAGTSRWELPWDGETPQPHRDVLTPPFPPLHPTQMVANYNGTTKELHMVPGRDIHWPGNVVPSDVPPCGFDHSDPQCRKGERWMGGGTTRGGPQPLTTPPLTLQPT